jgi:hypothetical protein
VTAFVDSNLAPGSYTYRVRAFAAADSSAWSNEAFSTVAAPMSIAVSAPATGVTLIPGMVDTIRWTAENVAGVTLHYTLDLGESWVDIPLTEGMVVPSDAAWGAFPWTVPAVTSPGCVLRVAYYLDPNLYDETGAFAIAACPAVPGAGQPNAVTSSVRYAGEGVLRVSYAAGTGARVLEICSLAGAVVHRSVLPAALGTNTAAVPVGGVRPGLYVARLRSPQAEAVTSSPLLIR